jgi:hypothetical protein
VAFAFGLAFLVLEPRPGDLVVNQHGMRCDDG